MKRVIKRATFHEGIFIPTLGDLGKALPSTTKTLPDLKMIFEDGVLEVSTRGHVVLIPSPNIIAMHAYGPSDSTDSSSTVIAGPTTVRVNTKTGVIKASV